MMYERFWGLSLNAATRTRDDLVWYGTENPNDHWITAIAEAMAVECHSSIFENWDPSEDDLTLAKSTVELIEAYTGHLYSVGEDGRNT